MIGHEPRETCRYCGSLRKESEFENLSRCKYCVAYEHRWGKGHEVLRNRQQYFSVITHDNVDELPGTIFWQYGEMHCDECEKPVDRLALFGHVDSLTHHRAKLCADCLRVGIERLEPEE